jgi:hypothetical protein
MEKYDSLVKDTLEKLYESKNKHYFSEEKAKEILREGLESELYMICNFGKDRIPCILSEVLFDFFLDIDAILEMDKKFLSELFFKYLAWEQVKQTILNELTKSGDLKENKLDSPESNLSNSTQITYSKLDIKKVIKNSFTVVRGESNVYRSGTDSGGG